MARCSRNTNTENIIIESLEIKHSEKQSNTNDNILSSGFRGGDLAEDSIKMDPQMARIKYGGSRANSKCIVNSYIDYLNMSQIEEEERMSDDVVASINSRKFSKATQNQSDNISVLISKEHSFSKNKFKEEARIDKQNQELIAEVDDKQEVLSSESRRESSTKIEEAHESPAVLSRGTEFQRSTTDTEEKNSSSKKKQAQPDKPGSKNLSTSCLKTTPKVIQNSLQKQSKDNKTSSKISNLEVKKIISTVNLGSSMTKNIILEKNKDQTQSIIVSSNQNPVPTLIINKSSKNHQSQHSHGTKQTQQTLKLPAERMSEKHSKKPQAQVKKTGNHRRTNSDTNNFSQVAHIINPLVTSARNTLKAPPSSNILSHKDHTQKEQAESAKTVPSKNVMMPSSVIKRKELDDLDVHHELRKQIAILKNENLHLKQENESFKKVITY